LNIPKTTPFPAFKDIEYLGVLYIYKLLNGAPAGLRAHKMRDLKKQAWWALRRTRLSELPIGLEPAGF
jgi:hypothetical protein